MQTDPRLGEGALASTWRVIQAVLAVPAPQPGSPGLAAEAKLALLHLIRAAGGVERSLVTHAAAVGAAIGSSTDRSGRRALETLRDRGFIDVPDSFRGQVTVFINDPLKVARARLGPAAGVSEQGELDFPEPPSTPREEPAAPAGVLPLPPGRGAAQPQTAGLVQDPPAGLDQDPPSPHKASLLRKDDNPTSNISHPCLMGDGGSRTRPAARPAGRPAPPTAELRMSPLDARAFGRMVREAERAGKPAPEPLPIGGLIAGIVGERVSADARATRVRDLVAWMHKAVGPGLARNADGSVSRGGEDKLLRIAWAVVDGGLPERQLYAVVQALDRYERGGRLRGSRAGFFLGSMRTEFYRRGLPWTDQPAAAPTERRSPS
jgi:hypothetical protein